MQVLSELKQRGVQDILLCCVDGLKGFPEAIEAIYPQTVVQTCIVHLIRHSLKYVPRRQREQVARDLKPIYTAVDVDHAQAALEAFDEQCGDRFPVITQAWLNAWEHVTPFLAFPPELRRVVYTTNAIEALNRQLRKAIKTKGHLPNEEAARKLIYLAITNAVPAWTRTRNWTTPYSRSRSTSAIAYPSEPPTQKFGRPHVSTRAQRGRIRASHRRGTSAAVAREELGGLGSLASAADERITLGRTCEPVQPVPERRCSRRVSRAVREER
jgi:hypothetical protein